MSVVRERCEETTCFRATVTSSSLTGSVLRIFMDFSEHRMSWRFTENCVCGGREGGGGGECMHVCVWWCVHVMCVR